jgi:hypothetical protein
MCILTHNSTTNRRQTVKKSSKRINITSCNTSTNLHKGVNNVHRSNNRTRAFFPPIGLHGPHQGGHWDRAIVNNRNREDGLAWVEHGNLSSTPWNNITCHLRENSPNLVIGLFRQDQYTRPFSGSRQLQVFVRNVSRTVPVNVGGRCMTCWVWNTGRMVLTKILGERFCPNATKSTNSTRTGLRSNPDLRNEGPVTNCLRNKTT